jgi:hypothetical protein
MCDSRTLTPEEGFQELFDRVQRLEAEGLVYQAILGNLVATFSALPNVGMDAMNAAMDIIAASADNISDADRSTGRALQKAFREISIRMKLKPPDDRNPKFQVIEGDKK